MSSSVPRYSLRAPISLRSSRGSSATMGYPSQPSFPLRRAACTARGSAALVVHRPGRQSGSCCRLALCGETGTRSRGETGCAGDREPVGQASPSPWRHRAAAKRRPERLPVPSSAGERSPDQYGRCATMTKHDPPGRSPITLPYPALPPVARPTRRVAVRYLSRREPRPDRSPRSQRSFAPSATYGNSASSRARLTARATWL